MKTQPTSYLIPKDTLDTLRTLAQDVGNMSGTLLHAIEALETPPSPPVTDTSESRIGELLKRFDGVASSLGQIATRVTALESRGATVVPPANKSKVVSESGNAGIEAPQARTATAEPDAKNPRVVYPPEVRRMAVNMRQKGKRSADIIIAIHSQCGYAPDKSNLSKVLNRWEKESDSSTEPLSQVVAVQNEPSPEVEDAGKKPDKKNPRFIYPPAVRRMALDMRKKGKSTDAIVLAIRKECGHAPGKNNLPRMLDGWEREPNPSSEPLARETARETTPPSITVTTVPVESPADSGDAKKDAPQARSTAAVPNKRPQRNYPPEIRRMAVDMRRKGKSNDAIISAIHKKCGYAPDRGNLTTYLNRWGDSK
ncbi:MAG: hypothetical protein WCP34_03615 [Pseudomonadota bacterium]